MGLYTDRGYTLEQAKASLLGEIDTWYGGATLDTFDCNVLGSMYRYECHEAAQLKMVNGKISNTSVPLFCGQVPQDPEADPTYDWVVHTSVEAGKIHSAYVAFTQAATTAYHQLKTQANAVTTVAEADTILESLATIL